MKHSLIVLNILVVVLLTAACTQTHKAYYSELAEFVCQTRGGWVEVVYPPGEPYALCATGQRIFLDDKVREAYAKSLEEWYGIYDSPEGMGYE